MTTEKYDDDALDAAAKMFQDNEREAMMKAAQDKYDELFNTIKKKLSDDESAEITSDELDASTKAVNELNTLASDDLNAKYAELDKEYEEVKGTYETNRAELETDYKANMDDLSQRWNGGEGEMTHDEYTAEHEKINAEFESGNAANSEELKKGQDAHSAGKDKAYQEYNDVCQANSKKHEELSQQWDKQIGGPEAANIEADVKEGKDTDKDADKGQAQGIEDTINKEEKGDKKKEKKDPMLELVDELNDFVKQTNKQITEFFKDKASDAWDKLKETGPMKTLSGALDEAKQFAKDKAGEAWDKVADSDAVNAASKKVSELKEKISDAFSTAMNSAANAIASGVHNAVTPKEDKQIALEPPTDGAKDPMQASKIDTVDKEKSIENNNAPETPRPTDAPRDDSSLSHS